METSQTGPQVKRHCRGERGVLDNHTLSLAVPSFNFYSKLKK